MKKHALVLSFISLIGPSYATTVWNPVANGTLAPDTGDFLETLNWTNGIMPSDPDQKAVFNVPDAATCLLSGEVDLKHVVCGDNAPGGTLILTEGANLTTRDWAAAGFNESGTIIVEAGATANFLSHLWIAHKNDEGKSYESRFIVNGGVVTVSQAMTTGFSLDGQPGGTVKGFIELNAGSLHNEGNFFFDDLDLYGSFDIEEGVWTLSGDRADRVNTSVANGSITGYGGEGTVNVSYDENGNLTVVSASPPPSNTPLVILTYTYDEESGDMCLTWGSKENTDYRIVYGSDLGGLDIELEEAYPADEGDSTEFPFNRFLLIDPDAERIYFRVEKVLP